MKKLQIGFGIAVIGLLVVIVFNPGKVIQTLGNLNVSENAYSGAATYATSSISTDTAKSLIVRATSSRTFAKICNTSANTVYLYKQSTSTGIITGMGSPLFATSSYDGSCIVYDEIDPYLGQIWGITSATSVVSVEYLQN